MVWPQPRITSARVASDEQDRSRSAPTKRPQGRAAPTCRFRVRSCRARPRPTSPARKPDRNHVRGRSAHAVRAVRPQATHVRLVGRGGGGGGGDGSGRTPSNRGHGGTATATPSVRAGAPARAAAAAERSRGRQLGDVLPVYDFQRCPRALAASMRNAMSRYVSKDKAGQTATGVP